MSAPPGRRAAARIAWRQARHAKWRTALVIATVALPVAGLALGLTLIRTVMPSGEQRATETLGSADLGVLQWLADPPALRRLRASLPPGSVVAAGWGAISQVVVEGRQVNLDMTEWSPPIDRPPVGGLYRLEQGRAPLARNEVALHSYFLEAFGVKVGDELSLADLRLRLRVTGVVAVPSNLDQPVAVLGPGTLGDRRTRGDLSVPHQVLIDLPAGTDPLPLRAEIQETTAEAGAFVATRDETSQGDEQARLVATATAFGGSVLALFGTGLVAAAAFVVGARRQLRTVGLVAATGGEPRQVRRVVLMGGVVLGALGSAIGLAIGIGAAAALYPHLEDFLSRAIGPLELPWPSIVGAGVLGILAATLAAFGPARSAGRLPPVEALAGRSAPPRPPGLVARRGLILLLASTVALAATTIVRSIPGLIASLVAMVCGFLLAIPLVTTWVGRLAKRLPASARVAAREVSRHGRRTGAALAAATMVLALPVSVSALTLSEEVYQRPSVPPMAADHLLVTLTPVTDDPSAERRALVEDLADAVPGARIVEMPPAGSMVKADPSAGIPEPFFAQTFVTGPERVVVEGVAQLASGPLIVGGPDLLEALHAGDGIPALRDGKIVGIGPGTVGEEGVVRIQDPAADPDDYAPHPAAEAGDSRYAGLGLGSPDNYVISPRGAARLGLRAQDDPTFGYRWILRAPRPVDASVLQAARSAAAEREGAFVDDGRYQGRDDTAIRRVVTGAAAAVALIIVGVVVALVAAESRRDHAILVAVGAGPWMRRKVLAANAWLLGTLGGFLAVPAGFLPVIVIQMARQAGRTVVVPWLAIATAVVAVPLLAALASAVASRQPKAAQLLRPIA